MNFIRRKSEKHGGVTLYIDLGFANISCCFKSDVQSFYEKSKEFHLLQIRCTNKPKVFSLEKKDEWAFEGCMNDEEKVD